MYFFIVVRLQLTAIIVTTTCKYLLVRERSKRDTIRGVQIRTCAVRDCPASGGPNPSVVC